MPGFLSVRPGKWAQPSPSAPTGGGVYISDLTDVAVWNGSGWDLVTAPGGVVGQVNVGQDGSVWVSNTTAAPKVSTDGGATWTAKTATGRIADIIAISATEVYALTEDDPSTVIYKSTDGGTTWSAFASGHETSTCFGLAGDSILYSEMNASGGGPDAHWVTRSGGAVTDIGLNAGGVEQMMCFGSKSDRKGWVAVLTAGADPGVDSGLYYVDDSVFAFANPVALLTPPDLSRYEVVDLDGTYVCRRLDWTPATDRGEIYRSTDGVNWTLVAGPSTTLNMGHGAHNQPKMVGNTTGSLFLIGAAGAVYHSTDQGVTWTDSSAPFAVSTIGAVP